jgi:DNA-binding MarR family transcriptional regulator
VSRMPATRAPSLEEALAADLTATWGGVRRRLRRGTRAVVGGELLTGSQVELLRLVEAQPGLGVGDAAAALHLAGNTVSTLVGGLAALDLMERRADPGDRRAARLYLTAAATRRLHRWRDERQRRLAAAIEALDPGDVATLRASLPALERLLAELERDA